MVPAPDRASLENGLLRGTELFYFDSPLDAFLVHGTACRDSVSETAPSPICFGGTNDRNTLGRTLKAQGLVRGPVTIETIREAYRRNPAAVTSHARTNGLSFSGDRC